MKKQFSVLLLVLCIQVQAQIGIGTTSPNSTLDIRGSLSNALTTFTANTTAGTTDNMLVFTGTSATTLTLPTAAGITGREYWIKNASSNSSVLTIATTSSQTVDGLSSWTLTQTNKAIRLVSDGANWHAAAESLPGSTPWVQGGNNVTAQQNLGTTSNYALPFITNNTEKMRLTTSGSLGIGTSTFNATFPEKLLVDAGTTTSVNAIVGKGSIDSYLQLNIQNNSTGASASSDVVATANNGNETTNYVDMGINGGSYTGGIMGAANDSYLYNQGQNFLIGTGTASKSLVFMTGGTSQATNERMRIDGTGKVGIGTTTPTAPLHVSASNGSLLYLHTLTSGSANIQFKTYTGTANPTAQIGGTDDGSYSSHITFSTKIPGADGNALSERVRISSAGNVGVGTTTPSQKMDVNGTIVSSATTYPNYAFNTANRMAFGETNVPANETGSVVQYGSGSSSRNMVFAFTKTGVNTSFLGNDGTQMMLGTESTAPITFRTGIVYTAANIIASGSERMRLTSTGLFGIGITAPTSTLHVTGSVAMALTTKTASYTATASDYTIICNNTSGGITITLPAASGCTGRVYVIKKVSGILNNVTIDGNGSENIDGSNTWTLTLQNESVMIQSDGSNWFILSKN